MEYKLPRGTHDILDDLVIKFQHIENVMHNVAKLHNFKEIRTPIFEHIDVFKKNVGESTDIITKEMYTFFDKKNNEMALKPEGTASIVRALFTNKFTHKIPVKWYYITPMFRYERPQKGRYRQFHQLGVEYMGIDDYVSDVEILSFANTLLNKLKISSFQLEINSLGSKETLTKYKEALRKYLINNKENIAENKLQTVINNPLRFLDSKNPADKILIAKAPKISEFYSTEDSIRFENIKKSLEELNIPYIHNANMVRGLDYYNHLVFEFTTTKLGAQNALLGGGRYNQLLSQMGNLQQGAIGFAAGMERLALLIEPPLEKITKIAFIAQQNENKIINALLKVENDLKHKIINSNNNASISLEHIRGKDLNKKLGIAAKNNYAYSIIIGEEELTNNCAIIRNMQSRKQKTITISNISEYIINKL